MTREERENAIRCLRLWIEREPQLQTYKTCLEALEQEPYDDAKYHEEHGEVIIDKAVWEDAKRALEQEPCEDDHDRCKDCMHELKSDGEYPCNYCKQNYKDMWEKKPHLIEVDDMIYKCSECGYDDIVGKCNFCPNCGARMVEPQEGSDKE